MLIWPMATSVLVFFSTPLGLLTILAFLVAAALLVAAYFIGK